MHYTLYVIIVLTTTTISAYKVAQGGRPIHQLLEGKQAHEMEAYGCPTQ
jgi:hypothetical protein